MQTADVKIVWSDRRDASESGRNEYLAASHVHTSSPFTSELKKNA